MNETIKNYIHLTSCKIVVNKLQRVLLDIICRVNKQMKSHVNISFAMLEFVWEFDMETNYKEVAYELHHIYGIVYDKRMFGVTFATLATCLE